ncbi:hypothetical protein BH09GEM1_BH09GEM1_00080 [soil metagenome]
MEHASLVYVFVPSLPMKVSDVAGVELKKLAVEIGRRRR